MSIFEQAIIQHGFESELEFHRLISKVPLMTLEQNQAFRKWQSQDGSKTGLLALFGNSLPYPA